MAAALSSCTLTTCEVLTLYYSRSSRGSAVHILVSYGRVSACILCLPAKLKPAIMPCPMLFHRVQSIDMRPVLGYRLRRVRMAGTARAVMMTTMMTLMKTASW